jgi:hypothetical protein
MTTPLPPRTLRVVLAALVIGGAALSLGAVLALITQALTGRASPLPASAPWDWSLRDIAHWFTTDVTASSTRDVAVRALAAIAWIALAAVTVNLLRELAHQARHGVIRRRHDPVAAAAPHSTSRVRRTRARRQHGFAATIVAILLGGSTLAASSATALPARAPAAVISDHASTGSDAAPAAASPANNDPLLPAGWHWGTHTVTSPHESLAGIAGTIGDDPTLVRSIWDANKDRDMGNGERFTDPAVVKLGWTLTVPTPPAGPDRAAPGAGNLAAGDPTTELGAEPAAHAATTHIVITEPGDTMWDQIDDVVDEPTTADVHAVAQAADGATTPLGPWVFDADNPDLIHPGMPFDLQPAINLHTAIGDPSNEAPPADSAPTPLATAPAPTAEPATTTAPDQPVATTPPADPGDAARDASEAPPAATVPTTGRVDTDPRTTTATASAPPVTSRRTEVAAAWPTPTAAPWPVPTVAPTPVAQPGDAAPPAPAPTHADDDPDTSSLPIVPIAAAGMTIGGLLIGLDRRRKRRQAHEPHGRRVARPDGDLATNERVLRAGAHLDRAARVDAALRHLADELAERAAVLRARYVLVDDTDVIVALHEPTTAPAGWEPTDDPVGWRCTLDDTALTYAADVNPHPWPAVVPLGVTVDHDATILIDLEALGITALTGPTGPDVCAAMICALGASTSPDPLTVVDDGHLALYGLERYLTNRIELDGIDDVLQRLDAWTEPFRFDDRHLLAQRHDDPGELEPCIAAIVAPLDDETRPRFQALPADGTRPIAVLTTDATIARTTIDVDQHGLTTFEDRIVRCHRLTPVAADAARRLIEHADTAPTVDTATLTPPAAVEQPTLFPPAADAWTVRLLGPLTIHHQLHGDLTGGRTRQLLILLALHPQGVSAEDIYDALVPDRVADPDTKRRYVKARMTELRKALGGGDTIAGRSHLPLTSTAGTDRYRVDNVDVDAERFRRLAQHPDDDLDALTAAMELIDGPVGDGEISWFPWASHLGHELHALIVDTGQRLAASAIAAGQPTLADWAATQTRLGVRFDQSVVPLAIRARSLLGDRVGVRRLRDEIVDTHNGELAADVKAAFDEALAAG